MSDPIGQRLSQARQARSVTLEQAAQATHIRERYLQALENGDFDALPSRVQVRGFLRSYAEYLGLDPGELLGVLQREVEPVVEAAPEPAENEGPAAEPAAAGAPAEGVPQETAAAPSAVDDPFTRIGERLVRQRELLGLSLDDVERHTHLRPRYLTALESGELDRLPSPVQGRGMLHNYAAFLGMDPEPLLLEFADGLQGRLAAVQPVRTVAHDAPQVRPPGLLRRVLTGEMFFVVVFVVFLAAFVTWGAVRIFSMRSAAPAAPTAISVSEVLLSEPTATQTFTPVPASPTLPPLPAGQLTSVPAETTPLADESGVRVYVTVRQRAWMRVLVDGDLEFQGRVLPGSAYQFAGDEAVEILTGNAAALQIFFNQQDLGLMGLFGEVSNRIYTREGMLTPTPTITPTPSATPRVESTPAVTPAP